MDPRNPLTPLTPLRAAAERREASKPPPTGTALVVAFLLVLLCWGLTVGLIAWVDADPPTTEDGERAASLFALGFALASAYATHWCMGLVNRAVTGRDL